MKKKKKPGIEGPASPNDGILESQRPETQRKRMRRRRRRGRNRRILESNVSPELGNEENRMRSGSKLHQVTESWNPKDLKRKEMEPEERRRNRGRRRRN